MVSPVRPFGPRCPVRATCRYTADNPMVDQVALGEVAERRVLGVPVSLLDRAQTLAAIESLLAADRQAIVVTVDASGLVIAQEDAELMAIYRGADLATPDSQGVVWALKRAGVACPERVSGVDLLDDLCRLSAEKGHRIAFVGAAPGIADLAAERMRLRHPGCNIVGTRHGFFPASDDELVAQEVAAVRPDLLFVALGIPRQEKFIERTKHIHRAKVSMGVGGSFDVFSGKARRAPKWVQAVRLEWLYRLAQNPKKLSKVRLLPTFVRLVLREPR